MTMMLAHSGGHVKPVPAVGFAQWKALLHLVLSCTSGLQQRPAFFAQACAALRHQLAHGMSQVRSLPLHAAKGA